jgi:NAD(P)-dependent dehydrogenase (short-subunit alcohol dehydrogenase family)
MELSKISLKGKVALVSGASRGIGEASALAFAEAGADVVVSSRKLADLEKVAENIKAKGVRSLALASHVAKIEESKSLVEKVVKEFGGIDILFNNAGTNPYVGPLLGAEEWAWDTTFNVNLKGPFFLAQLVAKVMKEKGGGCICWCFKTQRPQYLQCHQGGVCHADPGHGQGMGSMGHKGKRNSAGADQDKAQRSPLERPGYRAGCCGKDCHAPSGRTRRCRRRSSFPGFRSG